MASRVSIRTPQIIRAVFDSNATIAITLPGSGEVIDVWSAGPDVAIGGFTTEVRNGATNVIATVVTPNTNSAVARASGISRAYANLAQGAVLTFHDAAGDPTGGIVYVSFLPGVTATS